MGVLATGLTTPPPPRPKKYQNNNPHIAFIEEECF